MLKNLIKKNANRRNKAPDSLAAVNAMLLELRKAGQTANPVRLARLLTIADIWSLKLLGRPLHSAPYANIGGVPVALKIHTALRSYGTDEVTDLVSHPAFDIPYPPLEDKDALEVIQTVISSYETISTYALSRMLERNLPEHDALAPVRDDILVEMLNQPTPA